MKTKPPLQFTNENTLHLHCCEFPRYTRSRQSENYEAPGPIRAVCVDVKSGGIFFLPLASIYDTDRCNRKKKKSQNRNKPCGATWVRVQYENQGLVLFKPPDLSVPWFGHCRCEDGEGRAMITYLLCAFSGMLQE